MAWRPSSQLWNLSSQRELGRGLLLCKTWPERLRGLIGRPLPKGAVCILDPCNSIHTFFMGDSIDAVFVDREWIVRHMEPHLGPWRIVPPVRSAQRVIEGSAGMIDACGIRIGDRVQVTDGSEIRE